MVHLSPRCCPSNVDRLWFLSCSWDVCHELGLCHERCPLLQLNHFSEWKSDSSLRKQSCPVSSSSLSCQRCRTDVRMLVLVRVTKSKHRYGAKPGQGL